MRYDDYIRPDDFSYMPKTRELIGSQGMTFSKAYVPNALCCPSRTSILTGMYTHNHKVWFNENGTNGGWRGFKAQGHEGDNLATRLRGAGYRTGLFGKYLNGYDGSSVPQGWDKWFAFKQISYYNYDIVNTDGTTTHFGASENDYSTDVLNREVQQFIEDSAGPGKPPFFAYVAPKAPHEPSTPAPETCTTSMAQRLRGSRRSTRLMFRTNQASSARYPSFGERHRRHRRSAREAGRVVAGRGRLGGGCRAYFGDYNGAGSCDGRAYTLNR